MQLGLRQPGGPALPKRTREVGGRGQKTPDIRQGARAHQEARVTGGVVAAVR